MSRTVSIGEIVVRVHIFVLPPLVICQVCLLRDLEHMVYMTYHTIKYLFPTCAEENGTGVWTPIVEHTYFMCCMYDIVSYNVQELFLLTKSS